MGTITSGIGLVSGINTSSIIDQLMKLEAKPKDDLQKRIDSTNAQKVAFTSLATQLTSIKLYATTLKKASTFQSAAAASSNENVLTATTTGSPSPGTYQFQVARLVTTQQSISSGFSDYSTAKVGAGTITIEQGGGELTTSTPLSQLNGGAGARRGVFRLTDAAGRSTLVDTSAAITLDDVVKKINTSVDVSVRASIKGDKLVLTDLSGGTGTLMAQDVGDGHAAEDLGLLAASVGNTLTGTSINTLGRASLLSNLNDGRGVRTTGANDFRIAFADASVLDVNLSGAKTVGDVLDILNKADPAKVKASVSADGHGIQLTDLTGGGSFTVSALNGSKAAADLGIEGTGGTTLDGRWVLSTLNSTLLSSLKGGSGIAAGVISITDRNGNQNNVDLSGAKTVQDVIDGINAAGLGITASLKSSGNGIQLTDNSTGAGDLVIADDAGSTFATDLGIAGAYGQTTRTVAGANLQKQWVSENTTLASYNGGKGVNNGVFKITAANGATATIDLSKGDKVRLGDVISMINARGIGVTASVNANGDGLLLTDTTGGAGQMKVEDVNGSAAADLNIKGAATGTTIDGSFEKTITVTATDTLTTLQQKFADLNFGVSAQIINDGSAATPFRLSFTAKNSGVAGHVVLDMGSTTIGAQTLVEGQDAAVFVGSAGAAQPLLVTASRNQIAGIIPGVSLDLHSVSSSPVTLSVSRNADKAIDNIQKFADGFNAIVDKITELTKFDSSTGEKGILLGDSTLRGIQDQLYNALTAAIPQGGRFRVLADIGLKIVDGAKLEFDPDKFKEAYATDPDSITKFFTYLETTTDPVTNKTTSTGKGMAYLLESKITNLIDPVTGLITRENKTLDGRTTQFQQRIDTLDKLLDQKKLRLQKQFANMESVLASLQSQQSSLGALQNLATMNSSNKN